MLSPHASVLRYTYIAYLVIDSRSMKNILVGNFQSSFYFATPKLYVYKLSSIVCIIMYIRTQTSPIKLLHPSQRHSRADYFPLIIIQRECVGKNSTPEALMHFSLGTDSLITTQTKEIPAKLESKCYDIFLLHESQ